MLLLIIKGNMTSTYYQKWYAENREKVISNLKKKITCECGDIIAKKNMAKHRRTDKHKKKMGQDGLSYVTKLEEKIKKLDKKIKKLEENEKN